MTDSFIQMDGVTQMDKKIKSKTTIRIVMVLAYLLFLGSFAFIIVCGLLHEHGYGDFWWPLVGLGGFFTCILTALILIFGVINDALLHDIEDKNRQYDAADFSTLSRLTPAFVTARFLDRGFTETCEGFWRKKIFYFLKDSICYYAKYLAGRRYQHCHRRDA